MIDRNDRPARTVLLSIAAGGAIGLLVAAVACASRTQPRPTSLLLISIDTLRADHLRVYGYGRPTSPTIDALASRGVRFSRAWAHSPWTLPSHVTMLSGTHPFRHGVVDDGLTISPSVPLLAPILKARGYATSAVVSGFYVSSRFGFERGFDRFEEFGLASGLRPRDSVRAEEVTAQAIRDISAAEGHPFFLFAHYYDPHFNYDPPDPWNRTFDEDTTVVPYRGYDYHKANPPDPPLRAHIVAQYDEEIHYTDAMIGRLFDALAAAGRTRDTLIVLTADHGEELFDHGSWGHANTLYTEVLHVPLIFAGPGLPAGSTVPRFVRHEDLAPTILDLLGLPPEPAIEGTSYADLVRNKDLVAVGSGAAGTAPASGAHAAPADAGAARRLFVSETSRHRANLVGAIDGERELILDLVEGRWEFHDLVDDPVEAVDSSAAHGDAVGELLSGLLRSIVASVPDRWIVSWPAGASGRVRVEGLVVPVDGAPAPGALTTGLSSLQEREFSKGPAETRLVTVPPDAVLSFSVSCAPAPGPCAQIADEPIAANASASSGPRETTFRIDPTADAAKLRAPRGPSTGKAGARFRVNLETARSAAVPSNLTPEELERLRSLGYLH